MRPLLSALVLALALPAASMPAAAQRQPTEQASTAARGSAAAPLPAALPPPSVTRHSVQAGARELEYEATAGALVLHDGQGQPQVELGYVAYTLSGAAIEERPITFVFNGGPGAASAYLHLGGVGPRILPFGRVGDGPSAPVRLQDNPDTWLAFTDLVFVDPVGTGYSRFASEDPELRKRFWSVDGDIDQLARFVARYLARNGRLSSPKAIVGESYGGFRVPKVVRSLQTTHGVGPVAALMISPILDFYVDTGSALVPLEAAARLPVLAAIRESGEGRTPTRESLAEVEEYARGEYLVDRLRGPRDAAATARLNARLAEVTGLSKDFLSRAGNDPHLSSIVRELHRSEQRVASVYDGTVAGLDGFPLSLRLRFDDPVLDASLAPLTSAAIDYLQRELAYPVTRPYHLLNPEVGRNWSWSSDGEPPESLTDLASALALDANLRVAVVHGYYDLVTPYFATQLALDQLPAYGGGDGGRVPLHVVEGGHMFYTLPASRAELARIARDVIAPAAHE